MYGTCIRLGCSLLRIIEAGWVSQLVFMFYLKFLQGLHLSAAEHGLLLSDQGILCTGLTPTASFAMPVRAHARYVFNRDYIIWGSLVSHWCGFFRIHNPESNVEYGSFIDV